MFGVSVLMAGIALVLCTIFVLERPFGTAFQVGLQAFEMLVHTIEGTGQQ
jgi:ABC-type polysaccharide/polyol phosphate export permease